MSFEHSPIEERKSLLTGVDTGEKEREVRGSERPGRSSSFTLFAILVCLLCTGINIYTFNAASKPQVRRYYDFARLKRPTPFVGMDRVAMPDIPPEPILIYPNQLSTVNKAEPSRAYGDDPVRLAEIGGLVPPAERQFLITPEVSSIVEFRSIDYKMENCVLTVATPPASASNVTLGLGNNVVDIWNVAAEYPLNSKVLSWNSRPKRISKVGSVTITHGMNFTFPFSCPSDTLATFEFSAGGEGTYVDWVQGHKSPTPGVVMYQHASFA